MSHDQKPSRVRVVATAPGDQRVPDPHERHGVTGDAPVEPPVMAPDGGISTTLLAVLFVLGCVTAGSLLPFLHLVS